MTAHEQMNGHLCSFMLWLNNRNSKFYTWVLESSFNFSNKKPRVQLNALSLQTDTYPWNIRHLVKNLMLVSGNRTTLLKCLHKGLSLYAQHSTKRLTVAGHSYSQSTREAKTVVLEITSQSSCTGESQVHWNLVSKNKSGEWQAYERVYIELYRS